MPSDVPPTPCLANRPSAAAMTRAWAARCTTGPPPGSAATDAGLTGATLLGWLLRELDRGVLGVVLVAHAEPPLAADIARIAAGRDGEDLDLHVRVVHLGRLDHRLRARRVAVLLEDVGASHPLPLVDGDAAVERHDADVRLRHLEREVEGLAGQGGRV